MPAGVAACDQALMQKYEDFSLKKFIDEHNESGFSCCPTAGCPFVFEWAPADRKFSCPACKNIYCLMCKARSASSVECRALPSGNLPTDATAGGRVVRPNHAGLVTARLCACPAPRRWSGTVGSAVRITSAHRALRRRTRRFTSAGGN